jgi:hypothetical protein
LASANFIVLIYIKDNLVFELSKYFENNLITGGRMRKPRVKCAKTKKNWKRQNTKINNRVL